MKIDSAYIEINNTCNLDCRSCYNRSGKAHPRKELSLSQMQSITDRLTNEFGCSYISLAGGEPTLHSHFDEILHYMLSISDLNVGVVTNGTTSSNSLIDAYHTYPNLKIQVSVDGSCEEINAKTRGTGNFGKALLFLKELKRSGKYPTMKMVVSRNNLHDVEAYYRLAMSMKCEPDFEFINGMGNAAKDWNCLEPTAQEKLFVLRTLDRLNHENKQEIHMPFCTSQCPLSGKDAQLSVLLKCDGSMQPCQILYDNAYTLGNFLLDDTKAILKKYAHISEIAQSRKIKATEDCTKCLARTVCQRGCMALAVINTGNPLYNDGECTFRKLQILGYEMQNHRREQK